MFSEGSGKFMKNIDVHNIMCRWWWLSQFLAQSCYKQGIYIHNQSVLGTRIMLCAHVLASQDSWNIRRTQWRFRVGSSVKECAMLKWCSNIGRNLHVLVWQELLLVQEMSAECLKIILCKERNFSRRRVFLKKHRKSLQGIHLARILAVTTLFFLILFPLSY